METGLLICVVLEGCSRDSGESQRRLPGGPVRSRCVTYRGRDNILDQWNGVGETKGRGCHVLREQREAQHTCDAGCGDNGYR